MLYVKTGLAGYGPELDETDEPMETTRDATLAICEELSYAIDRLLESAPSFAEQDDYEAAYKARVKADELGTLAQNLDWDRRSKAPLYDGRDDLLTETMNRIIAETFPLDLEVDGYARLYVWEADEISKRYDVLDQNGDTLESFDSWGLATTYLRTWQTSVTKGNIRDNNSGELQFDRPDENDD